MCSCTEGASRPPVIKTKSYYSLAMKTQIVLSMQIGPAASVSPENRRVENGQLPFDPSLHNTRKGIPRAS
jgi:hypothetical protein